MLTLSGAERLLLGPAGEVTADIHCADGVVVADAVPGGEVLDVSGCVITPGLVNAHHHLFQTAFRTIPDTRGVPMARWLPTMAEAYASAGVDPELGGAAARAGLAEALLCGVTTVADHHLTWPSGLDIASTVEFADAVRSAAEELHVRLVFVRGSAKDNPYVAGDSAEAIAAHWFTPDDRGVTPDGMVQLAVGPAGVHSDPKETFDALAAVAAKYGLRRRTQANEQVDVAIALERYGRRPLELLDEWGWLAPDVTLAHLCEVTDAEIARLEEWFARKDYETGEYYLRRKAYDPAILYFKDVVEKWPGTPSSRRAQLRLVETYRKINYRDEADEVCQALRTAYPDDAEVLATCGPPPAAPVRPDSTPPAVDVP